MTVSMWQEEAQPPERVSHDVVVVGAGIVGSHAARVLAAAGKDTAIVEARFVAAGASGRNAGFVHLGVHLLYAEAVRQLGRKQARELWAMTKENMSRLRGLAGELGVPCEDKGATFVSFDERERAEFKESARLAQEDGFDIEFVDGNPLGIGLRGAMVQPGDFTTQPAAMTEALARTSGATLYENDEMVSVRRKGGGLTVRTRQHEIRCEKALLAVDGFAPGVHPFFKGLVEPWRAEVLVTEPLARITGTIARIRGKFSFQQLADGRLLAGAGAKPVRGNAHRDEPTPSGQRAIEGFVREHLSLDGYAVSKRWAGTLGVTRDFLPVIGRLPGDGEVYFAVGFSGAGNSLGLVTGERTVEMMLEGRDPGVLGVERLLGT
ncbi:MAG: FAD-binding oxidoreductase [SAR202 cluster bacterium]|nr:FAD-binding oxidoreductase [SAR202 cluster bacterium]